MKLRLLAALLLSAMQLSAIAEGVPETFVAMTLNLSGGKTQTVILADVPKITFSDNRMVIAGETAPDLEFPLDEMISYYFSRVQSGIESVAGDDHGVAIRVDAGSLTVKNLASGTRATLYNAQGITVASASAAADGTAKIDTSALPAGVYIVSYGNLSTKIVKK